MKKLINRSDKIIGRYESYSLSEFTEFLAKHIENLPEDQRVGARFSIDMESYPYDDAEYPGLFIEYTSPETDEEEKTRKEQEALRKKNQDSRDRAEFERLSKKFK